MNILLHVDSLCPAGAGVVCLAGGDLALEGLHLSLAVAQQGGVDGDVGTVMSWVRSSIIISLQFCSAALLQCYQYYWCS